MLIFLAVEKRPAGRACVFRRFYHIIAVYDNVDVDGHGVRVGAVTSENCLCLSERFFQ